jgi:plasmid stabilization system protein ParE
MAEVVYSAHALVDIERVFQVLDAVAVIQSAVDNLGVHPLIGRRVEGELRELVISYGRTGYVALYRFVIGRDQVHVLALRHQRELGYLP